LYRSPYRREARSVRATHTARIGRPRGFDRDEALSKAMELFWARGYDATTLTELQRVMGINAPSFYAAFESKDALFREAVELYAQTESEPVTRALTQAPTARAAVEGVLRAAAKVFSQPGKPGGCIVALGGLGCADRDSDVARFMRDQRATRHAIIEERLRQGVADGDLAPATDLKATATFYTTILDGIAVEARDGASRKTLRAIVDYAMAAWDNLASTER
jgi:AcrR family transcriptional regulator